MPGKEVVTECEIRARLALPKRKGKTIPAAGIGRGVPAAVFRWARSSGRSASTMRRRL